MGSLSLAPELRALMNEAGDACELLTRNRAGGLTRFANNGVHQHAEVRHRQQTVRVCVGERFGVATADVAESREQFSTLCTRARDAAAFGPAAPGGLPRDSDGCATPANRCGATAEMTPGARVGAVRRFTEAAAARGLIAAGAFSTESLDTAVVNSHGLSVAHAWTDAHFSATIMRPEGGSAWVERLAVDVDALDLDGAFETVFAKAERAADVETLPPGKYTVLLEPAAVGELLQFLAWLGFGGRQFLDGTSFMADKLGERITGEHVTIVDDCQHPGMPGAPFDYEGVPRRRLTLIERGVAAGVAYDTTTAAEARTESTGHALPQPNTFGPLPLHLVIAPGHVPREELLKQVDDGILVTRLWYNRVVDPGRTLITGLTRDGTFRIRHGTLGARVQDFRFNENILDAFSRIVALSDTLERTERAFVPAMVIEDFNFSSLSGAA